ncbi:uncharacterized protein [Excalfactoria chinensis]|uniref:uncharacterized protein n=1 Tax=Excalfactoria chinensis TaxID=46218 RepID=UPI003B3B80B2
MGNKCIFSAINHREDRSLRIAQEAARGAQGPRTLSAEDEECGPGDHRAACGTALPAAFELRGAAGASRGVGTAGGERTAAGGLCVHRAGAVCDAEGPGEAGGGGGGGGGTEARVGGSACAAGAAETTLLEVEAAAGPLRCGERRVRGGERPRGSCGGGAFVPRGPNKGAAEPDRAEPGGTAACAVPGAGGGSRQHGSGPRGERPPAGRARKESGDPDLSGSGCGKGCVAGRPCAPCPYPHRVHGSVTQFIPPCKSASGPG